MSQGNWLAIMRGDDHSLRGELWRSLFVCAEPPYRMAVGLRNALYDWGLRTSRSLGRPTISVGNITAGGTGKTPMVLELARRLLEIGAHPAVLLRGHQTRAGRRAQTGAGPSDETRLLQEEVGAKVVVRADPHRRRAARAVLQAQPDVNVFLLDDGFQHRGVRRDLDLVLVDATDPFGLGRLLPRGLLREPRQALGRAGAVVVTRADQVDGAELRWLDEQVTDIAGRPPVAHVAHRWIGYRDADDKPFPITHLQRLTAQGICGIGNPRAFASTLTHHAAGKLTVEALPDHHHYTSKELETLFIRAKAAGAHVVVTTEKDWVKWKPLLPAKPLLPVYRAVLRMTFLDGSEALDELLRKTVDMPKPAAV